jgi:hypothetical protein
VAGRLSVGMDRAVVMRKIRQMLCPPQWLFAFDSAQRALWPIRQVA